MSARGCEHERCGTACSAKPGKRRAAGRTSAPLGIARSGGESMAPRTARSERSCICGAILRASCAARLGPPCPARQQGKLAELAPPWRRLLLSILMLQSASFCQNKFAYPTVRMRRRRNCRCLPARFSKLRIALGDLLLRDPSAPALGGAPRAALAEGEEEGRIGMVSCAGVSAAV